MAPDDDSTLPVTPSDRRRWAVTAFDAGHAALALDLARAALGPVPSAADELWLCAFLVLAGQHDEADRVATSVGESAVVEVARADDIAFLELTATAARAVDDGDAWDRLRRLGDADALRHGWWPLAARYVLAVAVAREDHDLVADQARMLWREYVALGVPAEHLPADVRHHGTLAWVRARPRAGFFAREASRSTSLVVRRAIRAFSVYDAVPERADADLLALLGDLSEADARFVLEHAVVGLGTPALQAALDARRRRWETWRSPTITNGLTIIGLAVGLVTAPAGLALVLLGVVFLLVATRVPPLSLGDSRAVFDLRTAGIRPWTGEDASDAEELLLPGRLTLAAVAGFTVVLVLLVLDRAQDAPDVLGNFSAYTLAGLLLAAPWAAAVVVWAARHRADARSRLLEPLRQAREEALASTTSDAVGYRVERGPVAAHLGQTLAPLPGEAPRLPGGRTRALTARWIGRPGTESPGIEATRIERLLHILPHDAPAWLITQRTLPAVAGRGAPPAG